MCTWISYLHNEQLFDSMSSSAPARSGKSLLPAETCETCCVCQLSGVKLRKANGNTKTIKYLNGIYSLESDREYNRLRLERHSVEHTSSIKAHWNTSSLNKLHTQPQIEVFTWRSTAKCWRKSPGSDSLSRSVPKGMGLFFLGPCPILPQMEIHSVVIKQ